MRHRPTAFLLPALLSLGLLAACTTRPPTPPATQPPVTTPPTTTPAQTPEPPVTARYVESDWTQLPGWPGDQLAASWQAWLTSCQKLRNRADWKTLCADAASLGSNPAAPAIRQFFEQRFQPWQVQAGSGEDNGLITGYYEALLRGGLQYKPGRVPLHGVPDDLLTLDLASAYPETRNLRLRGRLDGRKVVPYWTRAEINNGKAPLQGKVLAWADNAIDAFFLQVQGSGRLQLEDGRLLRLGYADQNGHPYRSIGKWLAEQGEVPLEQVSMQRIKAWASANPARLQELLSANPSYVFFRLMPGEGGPIGALNVPLTDGASIAVDPRFVPLGTPVYLATTRPNDSAALTRLVHAQDTGGAIRGPVRADFFWGFGNEAGELAGKMKQRGQLWLLWPKGVALPTPPAS